MPPDAASDGVSPPACPALVKGTTFSDAATLKATGFTDGTIAPYAVCTTQNPAYGQPFTLDGAPAMKFLWTQVGYDGTRQDRGAEACSALAVYKEGWYGFKFYLPAPGFPSDKTQTIAQVFANGGCSSWAAMVEVRNNELWIVYRGNCVATPQYQVMPASDIPRNAWNPIVIHFIASSQNAGGIEIWTGGAICTRDSPTYRNLGINFAFGTSIPPPGYPAAPPDVSPPAPPPPALPESPPVPMFPPVAADMPVSPRPPLPPVVDPWPGAPPHAGLRTTLASNIPANRPYVEEVGRIADWEQHTAPVQAFRRRNGKPWRPRMTMCS